MNFKPMCAIIKSAPGTNFNCLLHSTSLIGLSKVPKMLGKSTINNFLQVRHLPTLNQIRRQKPRTKKKKPKLPIPKDKRILLGPQRKGVCVKLVVRTPKKPNSAQRKCAILRLSNGKLITAYIPGEKGVLQEHGVVLFEGGRVQDCPGIKYKIIRRKYDMN